VAAAKSDVAAKVQRTHETIARKSSLRYVSDKLDSECHSALTQGENFWQDIVAAGNESQAMENKAAKLTAALGKPRKN
jgi:hypothetical protein